MWIGCVGGGLAENVELKFGVFVVLAASRYERARRFAHGFAVPASTFRIGRGVHFLVGF